MVITEVALIGGALVSAASGTIWWYVRRMFTKMDNLDNSHEELKGDIAILAKDKLDREEFENTMERFDDTLTRSAKDLHDAVKSAERNTTQRIDKVYENLITHLDK